MHAISVLMKPASGMCNMKCDYCFYRDEMEKREQASYGMMSEQTLKNVIRKTISQAEGCISFAYQGGEPTLRGLSFFKKAVEYQKQYNKRGIKVMNALQTNGLLIDEAWCKFLKENHFLVGVSVDGTKELHDIHRRMTDGEGTYDRVCKAINLLEQYGVDYNILTVVHQQTANHVEKVYREYKRHGWNYQQYIACLEPLEEIRAQNSYALSPIQYGEFLVRLFDCWYSEWKQTGRRPYIRQFENYLGILLGYRPEACDQCGVCGIQYVVEADGSVYPCDFYMTDEYGIGNFNVDRMENIDVWRREIGFVERSNKLSPACHKCEFYVLCRGGCQRNRDYDTSTETYHNYFCESYRIFFISCLDRMREMSGI